MDSFGVIISSSWDEWVGVCLIGWKNIGSSVMLDLFAQERANNILSVGQICFFQLSPNPYVILVLI